MDAEDLLFCGHIFWFDSCASQRLAFLLLLVYDRPSLTSRAIVVRGVFLTISINISSETVLRKQVLHHVSSCRRVLITKFLQLHERITTVTADTKKSKS